MNEVFIAGAPIKRTAAKVEGDHVTIGGELFYRIGNYDAMPPFLMTVVSSSDHWLFISSTGGLTAGRRNADHALFPYGTDDLLHRAAEHVGGKTLLRVTVGRAGRVALWEPLSGRYQGLYRTTRNLYKSVYGNKLIFEEINHGLGLSFSATWMTSDRFGIVRRARLENLSSQDVEIEVLDGIQDVCPPSVTRVFEMQFSTLVDGYKESELEKASGLGLFRLSSVPTDRSEPSEALAATTVWAEGLAAPRHLLSSTQVDHFRQGGNVHEEVLVRGIAGSYFVNENLSLARGAHQEWTLVADVDQDRAGVAELLRLLHSAPEARRQLDEDVERGTRGLVKTVASADGLQLTGDDLNTWRHFSNALFNVMRGGVPDRAFAISGPDFGSFVAQASALVAERHTGFLDQLPSTLPHSVLVERAREQGDVDLERLAHEYLPLTFSRRHGDPSRPWNIFSIEVKKPDGGRNLDYQGNWRDIFQNWEALALSFPGYVESMIFKFMDASTADGYNPYRVTRAGFDWEVLNPDEPWSYIGYWGDHQVVYLLRLIEISARYHPGALARLFTHRVFTYAHVPYRLRSYSAMLEDPKNTIDFDAELDAAIRGRAAAIGADGKALPGAEGTPYHANLMEKLLVLVLARLFSYIPEAGLWMNTQRPEWNDANNALVGNGVSMVTLCYLRRFLAMWDGLGRDSRLVEFEVSTDVATAFGSVMGTLTKFEPGPGAPVSDRDRKAVLDELGAAGTYYRAAVYSSGLSEDRATLTATELHSFCQVALRHIDHSIAANRRPDGLYHAYNLMELTDEGIAVQRLYEMLEGQVAVLSSGALSAERSLRLLDALRASKLYRADQLSYLLYPDRTLPGFFGKNNIPAAALAESPTLQAMVLAGDQRIVAQDVDGVAHFNTAFRNSRLLRQALAGLDVPGSEIRHIAALYEEVFNHRSFTGRSGTFYKYEGLGCIYWHMVSKLLVAAQEVLDGAARSGADSGVVDRLRLHYEAIREGIGTHKTPDVYGAVPTDPYSHTPGFAGVQQPGMTGQVKEDIITRLGEMGVVVENGRLGFRTHLFARGELVDQPKTFHFLDADDNDGELELAPGTLAFTICQVPVVVHRDGPARLEATRADGSRPVFAHLTLDAGTSAEVFERSGSVRRLDVDFDFP